MQTWEMVPKLSACMSLFEWTTLTRIWTKVKVSKIISNCKNVEIIKEKSKAVNPTMVSVYQRHCLTLDLDTGNARFQADENWNRSLQKTLTCATDYGQLFHFTFQRTWTAACHIFQDCFCRGGIRKKSILGLDSRCTREETKKLKML